MGSGVIVYAMYVCVYLELAKETRASLQRLSTPVHHQRETEGEQYERIKELQDLVKVCD